MSSFASTLIRDMTPAARWRGIRSSSRRTPSTRMRTKSPSGCGKKWMSLAPSSVAWKMTELMSCTSGPDDGSSSSSGSSSNASSSSASIAERRTDSCSRSRFLSSSSISSRAATAKTSSRMVERRNSSRTCTSSGSLIATSTWSPSKAYGMAFVSHQHPGLDQVGRRAQHTRRSQLDERELVAICELPRDGGLGDTPP